MIKRLQCCGFTLVEVVLGMGVVCVALVAILGLLSVGVTSSRSSVDESLISVMSRQVISDLRCQSPGMVAGGTACFYDGNGIPTSESSAVYRCAVLVSASANPNLFDVTLKFYRPAGMAEPKFIVHTAQSN
jgi:uncharacterized protein (TIGR02598 family)